MYHRIQGLEVRPLVTVDLCDVVGLCYGPVPFPVVGGHLSLPADIVDEDILQRPGGEIHYPHGVHAPDLSPGSKLYRSGRLLFLGIVAPAQLPLFMPAENELVHVYGPVHGVVPAGLHGLADL